MTMKHKNYEKRKVDKKYYLQITFNLLTSMIVYYFIYIYREKLFVGQEERSLAKTQDDMEFCRNHSQIFVKYLTNI
jgi:hypothetical protein